MPRGFGRAEDNLQTSPAQLPVGGHAVWHNTGSGLYDVTDGGPTLTQHWFKV